MEALEGKPLTPNPEVESNSVDELFDLIFSIEKYEDSPMLLKEMQSDELIDIMTNICLKQMKPKKSYLSEVLLNATYRNVREEWDNKLLAKRKAEDLEIGAAKKMKIETGETSKNDQADVYSPKNEEIEGNSDTLYLDDFFNRSKNCDVYAVKDNEEWSGNLQNLEQTTLEQTKPKE